MHTHVCPANVEGECAAWHGLPERMGSITFTIGAMHITPPPIPSFSCVQTTVAVASAPSISLAKWNTAMVRVARDLLAKY